MTETTCGCRTDGEIGITINIKPSYLGLALLLCYTSTLNSRNSMIGVSKTKHVRQFN